MSACITLYIPLSPLQLGQVVNSGWRCFAPDSREQRNFYPKIYLGYAEKIARAFNAVEYETGYVVSFNVSGVYMKRYPIQTVAYDEHQEYQIPIEDLSLLNRNIVGRINVVSAFTVSRSEGVRRLSKNEYPAYH